MEEWRLIILHVACGDLRYVAVKEVPSAEWSDFNAADCKCNQPPVRISQAASNDPISCRSWQTARLYSFVLPRFARYRFGVANNL